MVGAMNRSRPLSISWANPVTKIPRSIYFRLLPVFFALIKVKRIAPIGEELYSSVLMSLHVCLLALIRGIINMKLKIYVEKYEIEFERPLGEKQDYREETVTHNESAAIAAIDRVAEGILINRKQSTRIGESDWELMWGRIAWGRLSALDRFVDRGVGNRENSDGYCCLSGGGFTIRRGGGFAVAASGRITSQIPIVLNIRRSKEKLREHTYKIRASEAMVRGLL